MDGSRPRRGRMRLLPSAQRFGLAGALASGAAIALIASAASAQAADADGDGVPDASDDCQWNANPHQEDSDGDGIGDVCYADTINPILERVAAPGSDFHARTPYLRLKYSKANGLQASTEGGLGATPNRGIGVAGADDAGVIRLTPIALTGYPGGPQAPDPA